MPQPTFSETADFELKVVAPDSWEELMAEVCGAGMEKSVSLRQQGHAFHVEILGARRVQSPKSFPLAAVMMDLDWKLAAKLEMVEAARDLITNAHVLDSLDGALPTALSAVIAGRGLFEYSMGEFFTLYGTFEGKHRVQGKRTRAKMLQAGERRRTPFEALCGAREGAQRPVAVRGQKHPRPQRAQSQHVGPKWQQTENRRGPTASVDWESPRQAGKLGWSHRHRRPETASEHDCGDSRIRRLVDSAREPEWGATPGLESTA